MTTIRAFAPLVSPVESGELPGMTSSHIVCTKYGDFTRSCDLTLDKVPSVGIYWLVNSQNSSIREDCSNNAAPLSKGNSKAYPFGLKFPFCSAP